MQVCAHRIHCIHGGITTITMNYRNYKGQYQTKKQHEERILRRFYTYVALLCVMIVVGIIAGTNPVEYIAPHAEAHEDVVVPDWDICDLHTVICEQEEPVQEAIHAVSEALGHDVTDETKKRINYLYERATDAGVPFEDAVRTIWCESQWMCVQSAVVKNGVREPSFCLSQIHAPSHPDITDAQLWDPYFNIDFLVENWANTKWYGMDRDSKTCTNGLTINL